MYGYHAPFQKCSQKIVMPAAVLVCQPHCQASTRDVFWACEDSHMVSNFAHAFLNQTIVGSYERQIYQKLTQTRQRMNILEANPTICYCVALCARRK